MARRKHGRPLHGWLILDKPEGVSSAQAVGRARRALDARKAGHAGTLDPDATGLLAIAFGEATKTIPFIADAQKAYRFTLVWGVATDTDDATGAVVETRDLRPDPDAIRAALQEFTGDILQVPPQVSAVKVDGARAYDLARAGTRMDLAARPLHVARLDLIENPDADTAVLEMVCGKGGYVRSIGRDLGERLGCLAHVSRLRRLWSGPFDLKDAIGWADLEGPRATLEARLLPIEAALAGVPVLSLDTDAARRVANGNDIPAPGMEDGTIWVRADDWPVAIGRIAAGRFQPDRVLVPS